MDPVEKEARSGLAAVPKEDKVDVTSIQPKDGSTPEKDSSFFGRAYRWLVIGGGAYVAFLLLLLIPVIQRNAIFMHNVRFPLFADFSRPDRYGLAPFKARNLVITTSDGERLGAWHVLPNTVYHKHVGDSFPPVEKFDNIVFDDALRTRPTVLFFHGNAGNRALSLRTSLMSSLSTALDVNALIIDYRGFGDSSGTPSEAGLVLDARATWEWAVERNGGDVSRVALAGQSLGTGVGSALIAQLAAEDIHPPLLALLSAYSSIPELLKTYSLFRIFPILSPLRTLPLAQNFFTSSRLLRTRFDSLSALSSLPPTSTTKILIAHAKNDGEIPAAHGQALFSGLLETALGGGKPELVSPSLSLEEVQAFRQRWVNWHAREQSRIERTVIPGWGELQRFTRREDGQGEVVYLEALYGGHDNLGGSEGVVALLGKLWGV